MSFPPPQQQPDWGNNNGNASHPTDNGHDDDDRAQEDGDDQDASSPSVLSLGKRRRRPNSQTSASSSASATASSPYRHPHAPGSSPQTPQTPPPKRDPAAAHHQQGGYCATAASAAGGVPPATMTVLVHRVDLYDAGHSGGDSQHHQQQQQQPPTPVAPYSFDEAAAAAAVNSAGGGCPSSVSVVRARPQHVQQQQPPDSSHNFWMSMPIGGKNQKAQCPFPGDARMSKYWHQRHRLFSRFDGGVQLDDEGWFSVTPEQIADHVAHRLQELIPTAAAPAPPPAPPAAPAPSFILLDAFGGCGGNAISFSKVPEITKVICVDLDRSKLRKAAHNARIYQIPPSKIVFIECNALFILEHCYRHGAYSLDMPHDSAEAAMAMMEAMPPPVESEVTPDGYSIGGIDLLPRTVDAVFIDPPWGGVDYELLGKSGYDLEHNMKIERQAPANPMTAAVASAPPPAAADIGSTDGTLDHQFFDTFLSEPRSKQERVSQFNCERDEDNCANGAELLRLAARATRTRTVLFDVPRNTNRASIGRAAVRAGYRGNCKLEEHYLNGRLKTVTVYFGSDWSFLAS